MITDKEELIKVTGILARSNISEENCMYITSLIINTYKQFQQRDKVIEEVIKKIKEHKEDLDYEPWSTYKISGKILFDTVEILTKYKGDSNE